MGAGIVAGVTSALVGSPLELVMIQQQRKGGGTAATAKSIAAPAHFYRGFVGAAVREGLWCCGYLSIPPIVRRQLRERYPEKFDSDAKARVPAALLGGLFACYLTQVRRRGVVVSGRHRLLLGRRWFVVASSRGIHRGCQKTVASTHRDHVADGLIGVPRYCGIHLGCHSITASGHCRRHRGRVRKALRVLGHGPLDNADTRVPSRFAPSPSTR